VFISFFVAGTARCRERKIAEQVMYMIDLDQFFIYIFIIFTAYLTKDDKVLNLLIIITIHHSVFLSEIQNMLSFKNKGRF